jgi:hypothetical protein
VVEILEHVTVKVLDIVDRDFLRDAIMAYDVLLEFFFDSCRGYVGDGLHLNPFHEVLHCHNGKSIVDLRWGEFVDYIDAPPLQRPRWGAQL